MTLRHLQIFRILCENNYSTTKTAQNLHMTQPAVSLAIKELEEQYDVRLFDRINRRLVITPAGVRLQEYCSSIETLFKDMETEMKNWDKQGVIRIGGTFTIGAMFLPEYAKTFMEAYPGTTIKGVCAPTYMLEKMILDNELDVGFCEGIIKNPLIKTEAYMDDRLIVFASADSGYSYGQIISVEEFRQNRFVLREQDSGVRRVFDMACEQLGFKVEPEWESVSNTAIIAAVAKGLGVGVIPFRLVEDTIREGKVVPVMVEGLNLDRKFYIVHHKDKKVSGLLKEFIQFCKDIQF